MLTSNGQDITKVRAPSSKPMPLLWEYSSTILFTKWFSSNILQILPKSFSLWFDFNGKYQHFLWTNIHNLLQRILYLTTKIDQINSYKNFAHMNNRSFLLIYKYFFALKSQLTWSICWTFMSNLFCLREWTTWHRWTIIFESEFSLNDIRMHRHWFISIVMNI